MAKDNMNTAAAVLYTSRGMGPTITGAQLSGSRGRWVRVDQNTAEE